VLVLFACGTLGRIKSLLSAKCVAAMGKQYAELWVDLSQALKHVHGYDHLARTFARLDEDCHRLAMV
jgi:hypothetical protein